MKNAIISHFKEKPKTKIAWWAFASGLAAVLEIPFMALLSSYIHKSTGTSINQSIGIVGIALTIAALITGTIAYRKAERSWVLWLGFGPALLLGLFWLVMIIAEIISAIFGLGF
ncbi:MAG: hypothetical protein NTY30_03580 [Candidatus Berkelbacteria bacterium]|nr:hypothetical protein [Candidatus Berkelbacteria bacterium]